ncbi:hypothetical protein MTO96_035841 [Rhipicephalus appendiculatus]
MESKYAAAVALNDLPLYWDPRYKRYFYRGMIPTPTGTPALESGSTTPAVEVVFSPETPAVTPIFVSRDAEGNRSRPSSGNRVRWMPGILSPQHTKLTKHVKERDVPMPLFVFTVLLLALLIAVAILTLWRVLSDDKNASETTTWEDEEEDSEDFQLVARPFRRPRANSENKTVTDGVQLIIAGARPQWRDSRRNRGLRPRPLSQEVASGDQPPLNKPESNKFPSLAVFIAVVVTPFLFVIVLSVVLEIRSYKTSSNTEQQFCCPNELHTVLRSVNSSIDPCEDFYGHVCSRIDAGEVRHVSPLYRVIQQLEPIGNGDSRRKQQRRGRDAGHHQKGSVGVRTKRW